jgi:NADH:ubiquinone oxidoreductase subunit 6 (subunit J)
MVFFGIIIGIVLMGVMVYFALDKKSSFHMRLAALGAIAVMILTVIICIIIILSDDSVPVDPSQLVVGAPAEVKEEGNNLFAIIFSIIFLIALFILMAILTMREHKRNKPRI